MLAVGGARARIGPTTLSETGLLVPRVVSMWQPLSNSGLPLW